MDLIAFYTSDIFKWVIIPILIFCARLIDVSLGTLRIVYLSRGVKYLVPLIGFIEINKKSKKNQNPYQNRNSNSKIRKYD